MNKLESIVGYLATTPSKYDLSKCRLEKLLFLADWCCALVYQKQFSGVQWIFEAGSPQIKGDLKDWFRSHKFTFLTNPSVFGTTDNYVFQYAGDEQFPLLSGNDKALLDKVISVTEEKNFRELIAYINTTYPMNTPVRYTEIDLGGLAVEYREKVKHERKPTVHPCFSKFN